VDPKAHADPSTCWFRADGYLSADPTGTPYEGEPQKVRALLARLGLRSDGAVLDIGGGPGFVAAALAQEARRVVLTEVSAHIVPFARDTLGVDTRTYDFQAHRLADVVDGPFELVLSRYGLDHCLDVRRFARDLAEVVPVGGHLVVAGFIAPTRGACLVSALEDSAPRVLWSESAFDAAFADAGWLLRDRFDADPPMLYWRPHRRGFRLASLPWELAPGPLARDVHQHHPGRCYTRGPLAGASEPVGG